MTLAIISHPECELHENGFNHPESPLRVRVIQESLKNNFKDARYYTAPLVAKEAVIAAHSKEYVEWLEEISPSAGFYAIDADTTMNPHTLSAAKRAAGALTYAVDLVFTQESKAVFCNIRPPGHHAERERAMGFCFYNNVAVGAIYAMQKYDVKRIAIIDFDVHHGNGTQNIFQNDEKVLYCSSFQHPFYPGYQSWSDNPHILSVPLRAGVNSFEFREKVAAAWFDRLLDFAPQIIFFSAGFDAHIDDPLADIHLSDADYVWITAEIAKIAQKVCAGKMISALEGGYNLDVLARCVPLHVANLIC